MLYSALKKLSSAAAIDKAEESGKKPMYAFDITTAVSCDWPRNLNFGSVAYSSSRYRLPNPGTVNIESSIFHASYGAKTYTIASRVRLIFGSAGQSGSLAKTWKTEK